MTFPRTVLAYLTGWLIVQPVYNRLLGAWRRRELERPGSATHAYFREQARAIIDEFYSYTPASGRPPVALEVIEAQHAEIQRLRGDLGEWRFTEPEVRTLIVKAAADGAVGAHRGEDPADYATRLIRERVRGGV